MAISEKAPFCLYFWYKIHACQCHDLRERTDIILFNINYNAETIFFLSDKDRRLVQANIDQATDNAKILCAKFVYIYAQ